MIAFGPFRFSGFQLNYDGGSGPKFGSTIVFMSNWHSNHVFLSFVFVALHILWLPTEWILHRETWFSSWHMYAISNLFQTALLIPSWSPLLALVY